MLSRALPRAALKAAAPSRLSGIHRVASALTASPAVLSLLAPRAFGSAAGPALAALPKLARDPAMAEVAARLFPLTATAIAAGPARGFTSAVPAAAPATAAAAKEGAAASAGTEDGKKEEKKPSRMTVLLKAYGPIAIATYLGIYLVTLGVIFIIVNANSSMSAEEIIAKVEEKGWVSGSLKTRLDNMVKGASHTWVNFAAAWILTKFTEPIRLVVTGMITPTIARRFGRAPPLAATKAAGFLPLIFIPALASRLSAESCEEEI